MKIRAVGAKVFSESFLDKLDKDKVLDLSAALAYYTALSIAPLLVFALMALTLLGDTYRGELVSQVQDLVGAGAAATIHTISQSADKGTVELRSVAGLLGTLTLLFSASALFGQLRRSLNTIFEDSMAEPVPAPETWLHSVLGIIREKVLSMAMVFVFILIFMVTLIVSAVFSFLQLGEHLGIGNWLASFIPFVIYSVLFASIYYFLPRNRIRFPIAVIAGMMTAILFNMGKVVIGLFLGMTSIASFYGAAGSLIILLMWVYYSAIIIFISAEVANEMNKLTKI